ncbi:MAG: T9SS type A sorting domain-containing protein, partial [Bacteroidota bacterium]
IIESTDTVSFAAADYILLQAGFHAEHESYFKAQITACTEALSAPLEQRSNRPVFSIYPNPTSEQLTIQFETSFEEQPTFYALYNLQGQKIRSGRWDQADRKIQQLDVSQLVTGTYVLQVGDQVKKVVVVQAF